MTKENELLGTPEKGFKDAIVYGTGVYLTGGSRESMVPVDRGSLFCRWVTGAYLPVDHVSPSYRWVTEFVIPAGQGSLSHLWVTVVFLSGGSGDSIL